MSVINYTLESVLFPTGQMTPWCVVHPFGRWKIQSSKCSCQCI